MKQLSRSDIAGWIIGAVLLIFAVIALAGPNDNNADLSWDAVVYSGPITYHVQRTSGDCALPDDNPWVTLDTVDGVNNTTYVDPDLIEGGKFCYRVAAAADAAGNGISGWSARAEFDVPFGLRPAPANLNVQ